MAFLFFESVVVAIVVDVMVNYSRHILSQPFFLSWIKLVVINDSSLSYVISLWVVYVQLIDEEQVILRNLTVLHMLNDFHLTVEVI